MVHFFLQKKWMGFFSHTHVAGEGRLLLFFCVKKTPGKHKIWPASYGQFGSLRVNLKRLRQMKKKKRDKIWRIIPVSKWLVTPMYKPFSPFGKGITSARGRINHGY